MLGTSFSAPHSARSGRRDGVSLLEVLVAIFIMGIGLLALLTLFPLGALELAQSIRDDRAGQIANSASALSLAGEELLARTREFVMISALQGSADPKTALVLRGDYGKLNLQAADIEADLREIRPLARSAKTRRLVDALLVQIRSIQLSCSAISGLLAQLAGGIQTD
jgi:prepilin-type N-terminal cleavage/methylation domain-containing protein